MASRDGGVRLMQVTAGEALAAQLAETAILAAIEALRAGGYPKPTDEQRQRIAHAVTQEALVAGPILVDDPAITDELLDQAAIVAGHAAVREVLGPPPMSH